MTGPCPDRSGDVRTIVHVSADFPDPFAPSKTPVIRSLLELTKDAFAHRVISLNRRMPRLGDCLKARGGETAAFEWGEAQFYPAPPLGLFHATLLRRLGRRLADDLARDPPALLVGHKLTIEGLAVAHAARELGIPYAITLQGNTDTKVLAARPDLAPSLARVFHEAAMVFAFAPWTLHRVEHLLGKRSGPSRLVACPTDLDTPVAPVTPGEGLLSLFHLRHFRNKNLRGMASALRLMRKMGEHTPFTLLGGGSDREIGQCRRMLRGVANASVAGALDRAMLRDRLNRGTGFVLPSHRESFGLVFVEALFAGLPIVYPQDRAVAGWFDGLPFAIPVDPQSPRSIAAAMDRLVKEEADLKQALSIWQGSTHALQFTRPHIAAEFAAGLAEAMSPAAKHLAQNGENYEGGAATPLPGVTAAAQARRSEC